MNHFDKLNEDVLPINEHLSRGHKAMHVFGAFSTDRIFNYTYIVLNTFILFYSILRIDNSPVIYYSVVIILFLFTFFMMWMFRPISKKEYRQLWIETKKKV